MRNKTVVLSIGIVIGITILGIIGVIFLRPYTFNGTAFQAPMTAANFQLQAASNQVVQLSDLRGKIVILYFGYMYCPDVCPATLSEIAKAVQALVVKSDDVQVIMISVDPARDTPEQLANYVKNFDSRFIGVTGSEEDIARVTALYGIYYEKEAGNVESGYLVSHTASVMVIDKEGYLKLVFPFGLGWEKMASDLRYLLR